MKRTDWAFVGGIVVVITSLQWLVMPSLHYAMSELGFDSERAQLLAQSLTLMLATLVGCLSWARWALVWCAVNGYALVVFGPFWWGQVAGAGITVQGATITPSVGAIVGMLATLVATVALCTLLSAAAGMLLRRIAIEPWGHVWQQWRQPEHPPLRAAIARVVACDAALILAWLLVITGIGPLLTYGPQAAVLTAPSGPRNYRTEQHTWVSATLGHLARPYIVALPPSYATEPTRRYPVVYLLHGSPGNARDWIAAGHAAQCAEVLMRRHQLRDLIFVLPDGNGRVYPFSEWANSYDGRQRMEDAVVNELVPTIDRQFRTLATASGRIIGGNSMGGYGAANLALHHPAVFGGAIILGGYFHATGSLFGDPTKAHDFRTANSPAEFMATPAGQRAVAQVRFVIGIGRDDARYASEGRAWFAQLQRAHAQIWLLEHAGGHAWSVWADQLAQSLTLLFST